MKRLSLRPVALALAIAFSALAPASAQQVLDRDKLAQTGFKFLSVAGDPRAAALSSAMTASEGGASMLFYNPAGMAWMDEGADVNMSQTRWISGIDYNHGAVAFRPANGRYGVIGATLTFVDYGDLQETIRADNDQGYVDVGTFSPTAFAIGLGYARAVTDRFSVGGEVKYADEDFGDIVASASGGSDYERDAIREGVPAFDFGVHYKTGFRSLAFAVAARNFAPDLSFAEESFQTPLTLQIGGSMDVVDLTSLDPSVHSLVVSADASNPRDYSEQIKVGGEYRFMDTVSLRAGYTYPTDEEGISLGVGVRQSVGGLGLGADYSYTDFGVFSGVHRVAIRFSL